MAMWNWNSTSPAVEAAETVTAILPVGATEQHGPHLPLSVDTMIATALARGVGERLGAYVLPAMPFGNSRAHRGFRGTVWLSHDSLNRVVAELIGCLFEQGFRRVVVLNVHGGNIGLASAVRDANATEAVGRALLINPLALANVELEAMIETLAEDRHAGELETSLVLHLEPRLVAALRLDAVPSGPSEYFDVMPMNLASRTGVWGRPSRASRDKGRKAFSLLVRVTADHVAKVFSDFEVLEPAAARDAAAAPISSERFADRVRPARQRTAEA